MKLCCRTCYLYIEIEDSSGLNYITLTHNIQHRFEELFYLGVFAEELTPIGLRAVLSLSSMWSLSDATKTVLAETSRTARFTWNIKPVQQFFTFFATAQDDDEIHFEFIN